jgi:hypothetical protein
MYNGIAQNIINDPGSYSIEMLTKGVQNGTVPAYIGIPLIEQKTQELNKSKALMGGMEQGQPPIAQEVLDKAQMATGLDELSSGLPAEGFAPGGIVAFADGGEAEDEEDEFDMSKDEQQLFDMLRRRLATNNEYEEMAGLGALPVGISKAVETKREVSSKVGDQPKQTKSEGITQLTKEGTSHGDLINKIMMKESGGRRFDKNGNLLQGPQTKYGTAKGEMQVLDSTARDPGYGIRPARPNDPDDLARVGREYFGKMLNKYGDTKLAAIAYNWGPGNTDKWLMAGADPAKLPRETQKYSADMAGGGPVHFQSGGISDIFNMSKEEVADFMRRKLRMEQARDAFSKVPAAAPAAAAEAAKPLSFMEYLKQGASKIRPGIGGMGVGLPALLRSGDLNEGEDAELERRRKMPMTLGTAPQGGKPVTPAMSPADVQQEIQRLKNRPPMEMPPEEVAEEKPAAPEAPTAAVDPMGNFIGEYAAYLKDQKESIAKDKEQNKYLALLQAGLGIMGGTSPYAGANIGQGAGQGVAAYLAGQKQSSADTRALQQGMLGLTRAELYDKMHTADLAQKKELKAESNKTSALRQSASELEGFGRQLTAIEAQIARSVDAGGKLAAMQSLNKTDAEISAERQRLINEILAGDSPAARRYRAITKSMNKKLGVDFEEPSSGASSVLTYDRNTKTLR